MHFAHTTCVINTVYGETLGVMSLRVMAIVVSALALDQCLRDTVTRTPEAVVILTRHWLQEDVYLGQIELTELGPLFSAVLRVLLKPNCARDCIPIYDMMITAAGDAQTVARISIEHCFNALDQSSQSSMDYWFIIHTHLDLIHLFSSPYALPYARHCFLDRAQLN